MTHDSGIDVSDFGIDNWSTPSAFWFEDRVFWTIFCVMCMFVGLGLAWVILSYFY